MQIALTQKGQAAMWVTNGCTSMSKPITTWSTSMGVDNKVFLKFDQVTFFLTRHDPVSVLARVDGDKYSFTKIVAQL